MNEVATIPKHLNSRLNNLAKKLEMNERDMIEALLDWTEVSLSLADLLEIDRLNPNVLYDRVKKITVDTSSNQDFSLDKESIQKFHHSVELLSTIVADQKSSNKEKKSNSKKERKVSSRTIEAEIIINHAIDQLIKYNEQDNITHKDKLRIGFGAIKTITGKGEMVIRRVLKARKEEIDQYHLKHKLEKFHNCKGKKTISIDELVFLDEDFLTEKISAVKRT